MTTRTCDNCNVSYGPDDVFCENCGYDFITGSLPTDGPDGPSAGVARPAVAAPAPSVLSPAGGGEAAEAASGQTGPAPSSAGSAVGDAAVGDAAAGRAPAGTAAPGDAAAAAGSPSTSPAGDGLLAAGQESGADPAPAAQATEEAPDAKTSAPATAGGNADLDVPRLRIEVAADRAYFDEVVNEGEIDFPDPAPSSLELELAGRELHIGRTSESRAIHPDIDVAALTGDQAVSSRHAVLRVANDGTLTVVDVGSTNGTLLDEVDSEAIIPGVPVAVKPGVAIFLGAWTRLTVLD